MEDPADENFVRFTFSPENEESDGAEGVKTSMWTKG